MRKRLLCISLLVVVIISAVLAVPSRGSDVVPVAIFRSDTLLKGAPPGWELMVREGTPQLRLEKDGDNHFLYLRGDGQSAFGIQKELKIDPREYPFLNWRWKAVKLPQEGDVRRAETDDQALQLYLAFSPTGFPRRLNTPVIGYIWDNMAPKEWKGRSSQMFGNMLRYVVVRNRHDKLGQWYEEKRNIYQDYRTLFGEVKGGVPQGPIRGIKIYINTQHTKSEAAGFIGEIFFSKK